jgi:hypothetical protein
MFKWMSTLIPADPMLDLLQGDFEFEEYFSDDSQYQIEVVDPREEERLLKAA